MESSLTDMIEGKAEELRLAMMGENGDSLGGLFARELSWGHSTAHVET